MNLRAIGWGVGLVAAGVVVAAGWLPGAAGWAPGPRVGVAMALLTLGGLCMAVPLVQLALRRSATAGEEGGCPVGATCACGHFNFKPRRTCRQCGASMAYAGAAR